MTLAIKENIPLASYTVFKIGGPARFFVEVKNGQELKEALEFARERSLKFFILGAGSNVLVSDKGFSGLVIRMIEGELRVDGCKLLAGAGVMMARAVAKASQSGLGGFEWGMGIPGTIGGSIRGNAGCFGGEMKDVIESVEVLKESNGEFLVETLGNKECGFKYRYSVFKSNPEWIITQAILALKEGDKEEIQKKIHDFTYRRSLTQDIGAKCAGCIFKNISWDALPLLQNEFLSRFPEIGRFSSGCIPAGYLIDQLGLKGFGVGGAWVSRRHGNYFINSGGASAEDIVTLISLAKERVHSRFGLLLEEEIQYVGF